MNWGGAQFSPSQSGMCILVLFVCFGMTFVAPCTELCIQWCLIHIDCLISNSAKRFGGGKGIKQCVKWIHLSPELTGCRMFIRLTS